MAALETSSKKIEGRKLLQIYKQLDKLHKQGTESFRRLSNSYESLLNDYKPIGLQDKMQDEILKEAYEASDTFEKSKLSKLLVIARTSRSSG